VYRVDGNEKILANEFNNYFCSIVAKLSDKSQNADPTDDYPECKVSNSFGFIDFTVPDICEAISGVANKESSGRDGITAKIVKEQKYLLAPPLTKLFNLSIKKGIFPEALKTAIVVPVYKSGDKMHMTNYRPIALLSVFSKIFETLIKKRVLSFLLQYEYFSEKQFGFLPGKCTDDALVDQITEICGVLEEKKMVAAVYLDISKAFDTVDHRVLLRKLENCGIRSFLLQ